MSKKGLVLGKAEDSLQERAAQQPSCLAVILGPTMCSVESGRIWLLTGLVCSPRGGHYSNTWVTRYMRLLMSKPTIHVVCEASMLPRTQVNNKSGYYCF